MIKLVYFDLDGVLADFEKGVFLATGKHIPSNMGPDGFEKSGLKDEVFNDDSFFENLLLMDGAKTVFKFAKQNFPDVQILSAYGKINIKAVQRAKHKWVMKHFPNTPVTLVHNSNAKGPFGAPDRLLIDDRTKSTKAFSKNNGNIVLFKNARQTIEGMKKFV